MLASDPFRLPLTTLTRFYSNGDDLFDEDYTAPSSTRQSDDFRDDFQDDEYTSVERTSTTTTEKIKRARKSRSGNRADLGPYKDDDSKVNVMLECSGTTSDSMSHDEDGSGFILRLQKVLLLELLGHRLG